jgi:hypothetical protein
MRSHPHQELPTGPDRPQVSGLGRRRLLRGAGLLGAASLTGGLGTLATGAGPAVAAPAGFPNYTYLGQALNHDALRYNPNRELIFPCVRGVYDRISGGLGRYYLYYAPHDEPGGICLRQLTGRHIHRVRQQPDHRAELVAALLGHPCLLAPRAVEHRDPAVLPVLPR